MHIVFLRTPPSTQVPLLLLRCAMPNVNSPHWHHFFWHPEDVPPGCDIEWNPYQASIQPFIDRGQ